MTSPTQGWPWYLIPYLYILFFLHSASMISRRKPCTECQGRCTRHFGDFVRCITVAAIQEELSETSKACQYRAVVERDPDTPCVSKAYVALPHPARPGRYIAACRPCSDRHWRAMGAPDLDPTGPEFGGTR